MALFYVAGLLLANFISFPLAPLFLLTLTIAVTAIILPRLRLTLLAATLLLVGALNLTLNTAIVSPHDLRSVAGESEQYVTLRGELKGTPRQRLNNPDDDSSGRTLARLEVSSLRREREGWQPATGTVAMSAPGNLCTGFFDGQTIEVSGILQSPPGPLASGLFDYRTYLRHSSIYYQLRALSSRGWQMVSSIGETAKPPVADRFCAWAQRVLAQGLPQEDKSLRLLWAMALGWRTALTGEVSTPFMQSGTMHIFAISGLHIALLAGILVGLLRVLRVPREMCGLIVIPLIWFYTGVTGWQASAIRSSVMMSIVICGWALRRPGDLLNSLAAAALIILVAAPQQLFHASFQLSFSVVLSLALFAPVLEKIRQRWIKPDPLVPDDARPRWQKILWPIGHWFIRGLVTSLAAWLGSMPLVAWYFHLFTPVSLLANLAIVPLSSLALAATLGSLLVGGWWPWLSGLFNHSAWFFMTSMEQVSGWCSALPCAYYWVTPPSVLVIACYYIALITVMSGILRKPRWRVLTGLGLLLMCGVAGAGWWREKNVTQLTILPLSGGSAVFCDEPGNANDMLVDCGNEYSGMRVIVPFLHGRGVNHIPRLVLTHGDLQDIGGSPVIEQTFDVKEVVTSPINFRSPTYREIVNRLKQKPHKWQQVVSGEIMTGWRVLHPYAADKFPRADDAALVLAREINGVRVLLLSDLGRPGQEALQGRETDLKADIVVSGLPDNGEPLGNPLLGAIKPKVIILSDSEFPATRRASPELRKRLEHYGSPVFFTRDAGAVTITLRNDGWEVADMANRRVIFGSKH